MVSMDGSENQPQPRVPAGARLVVDFATGRIVGLAEHPEAPASGARQDSGATAEPAV
jgi:hypothetical protein